MIVDQTPSGWKVLVGRQDVVLRAWNDRKKELEDLALAVVERIKVQENYSKGLDRVSKIVQKNIKETGVTSFAFSAFQSDHLHRAEQAKQLADSLRDQVQQLIRKVLDQQAAAFKKLNINLKTLDKEILAKKEQVDRIRNKFLAITKEYEDGFVSLQAAKLSNTTSTDKKNKAQQKYLGLSKDYLDLKDQFTQGINDYNQTIVGFELEVEKGLQELERQELQRVSLQLDVVMKFLVFQTSMIKNHEYDIDNIGKQLQTVKPASQLQTLKQQYLQETMVPRKPLQFIPPTFISESIRKVESGQFSKLLEESGNKSNRQLIQAGLKGHSVVFSNPQVQTLIDVVNQIVEEHQPDLSMLGQVYQSGIRVQFYWILKLKLQQKSKYQLSQAIYALVSKYIKAVIELAASDFCSFVISKLLHLSNIYFKYVTPKKDKKEEPREPESPTTAEESQAKLKFQLIYSLIGMELWKNRLFWQSAIILSIEEEGSTMTKSITGEVMAQTIERQLTTKLGRLAQISNYMLMLLINTRQVRILVGRFCVALFLNDQQNKSLSSTIKTIFKQVLQVVEGGHLPPFGHTSIAGLEDGDKIQTFSRF